MSTNNNRLGKEIQPVWIDGHKESKIAKVSGLKLQRLMTNSIGVITALSLKDRGIEKLEDFLGFSRLQRLDISENGIKRLGGMADLSQLGMLNVSKNSLDGSSSCEDLRYLIELRTLNIGFNPKIKHLESHVMKPLVKLQALVANDCGFSRVSFLKYCQGINTLVLSKNSLLNFPTSDNLMFERLTKLSLGHNSLTTVPDLTVCPHLVELRLNNNLIATISDVILIPSKLKVLELSSNLLASWDNIDILKRLKYLTNLSLKGNPLPPPPDTYDGTQLREDNSADKILDDKERRYRHHVLSMFQIRVGALDKPKIQLIVLDMKRVKMKWSHRMGNVETSEAAAFSEDAGRTGDLTAHSQEKSTMGGKNLDKKQKLKEQTKSTRKRVDVTSLEDMSGDSNEEDDDEIYAIRRDRDKDIAGKSDEAVNGKKKQPKTTKQGKVKSASEKITKQPAPVQPQIRVTQGVLGHNYSTENAPLLSERGRVSGKVDVKDRTSGGVVFEDVNVTMADIGDVVAAAPVTRGDIDRVVGDSGVLAVKVFKRGSKGETGGDAAKKGVLDGTKKKRKEMSGSADGDEMSVKGQGKKFRGEIEESNATLSSSIFAMPSEGASVFGMGGSSQW